MAVRTVGNIEREIPLSSIKCSYNRGSAYCSSGPLCSFALMEKFFIMSIYFSSQASKSTNAEKR